MDEQLRIILIIIVSVSIFGLIVFVITQFLMLKPTYVATYMNCIYLYDLCKIYKKKPDNN